MNYQDLATTDVSTKGHLPDRNQYDIHCPLMGGPDYKFNYLLTSCDVRQGTSGCSQVKCRHHEGVVEVAARGNGAKRTDGDVYETPSSSEAVSEVGAKPGVDLPCRPPKKGDSLERRASSKKEIAVATNKRKAICKGCGRHMTILARGICARCYKHAKKDGCLDKYASGRSGGVMIPPRKKSPAPVSPEQPVTHTPDRSLTALEESRAVDRVLLIFEQRDHALLKYLRDLAARERRTVEWQIVAMLDRVVDELINGEAA